MQPPVLPPVDEYLFIPDAIDFNLKNNPFQPCFTYANPATDGTSIVTHLEFGRAAHRAAHALRPYSGREREVVALIALSDTIFYQAIVAGLIVAGYVPFPISPRNTPAAIVNLLEKTSCYRLIATQVTLDPLIQGLKSYIAGTPLAERLQIEEVPPFQTVYPNLAHELPEHPFECYPPIKRPSKDDPCIYIHSSGSTGFPKPIPQTYGALVQWALSPCMVEFRDCKARLVLACMPLPPFHTSGLYNQIICTLYGVVTIALYPPTATSPDLLPVTPSPQNILEHSKANDANVMIILPSILEDWSQSPENVEYLKHFIIVIFAGGSLAPKLGNHLVEVGVNLHSVYGTTEIGGSTRVFPLKGDERDWEYVSFHEGAKVRWVSEGNGTFECQLLDWEKHTPMVCNLEDVKGYATSDLFENHPTKKHLWKIVGRKDDVIIHATGEKTVPAPIEGVIMSNPLIQAAVMFGRERDQAGVIIEPRLGIGIDAADGVQVANFQNEIWPIIEEANKVAPAFSRIFKDMILISSKDKPLPRTTKGTIIRKAAVDLYAKEINALYTMAELNLASPASWSLESIETWITEQASGLVPSSVEISPTRDLFEQGFDSLSAAFLGRSILNVFRTSLGPDVSTSLVKGLPQNLVYSHPVIKDLASHIVSLCPSSKSSKADTPTSGVDSIEALITKYTAGFSSDIGAGIASLSSTPVVLLTGSTGNLGSEILAALLENDRVCKVYAFNRPSQQTLLERHLRRFEDKGLDADLLRNQKLVFVSGDAGKPGLGLDREQYSQLQNSVNVVIHNSWKLDFNLALSSFEPHIRGTRHIIDFIQSGPNASNTRFLFLSSVASAQSWDSNRGAVPEEVVTDISSALGGGYGESKYVAEMVLAQSGLLSTSIRIGQISGGIPNGAWATTDWVPILVKTSITLGMLPGKDETRHASWLPMDTVAASIVRVALTDSVVPSAALNLVHPRPVKWMEIIVMIQSAIQEVLGHDLVLVLFDEWMSTLEAQASNATVEILETIPAVKLLDFFRSFTEELPKNDGNYVAVSTELGRVAAFSMKKMLEASGDVIDVGNLPQIGREDAKRWIKYWQAANFLS